MSPFSHFVLFRSSTKSSPADTSASTLCSTACSPSWWTVSVAAECCPLLEGQDTRWAFLLLHSFSVPEEPLHGGSQQAAPPAGGLLLSLVPPFCSSEPQPGLLPAGGLQQHHPVSVWWWGGLTSSMWHPVRTQTEALSSPSQGTSTWFTPSFVRGTSSTSWPTCRRTPRRFRKPYRGGRSPGSPTWALQMSPWRAPDLLYLQNPGLSKPVWRPLQVGGRPNDGRFNKRDRN